MQIMSQGYSFLQGYSSEYFLYIYVANDHVQLKKKKPTHLIQRYIEFPVLGRQNTIVSLKDHFTRLYCYGFITEKKPTIAKQKQVPQISNQKPTIPSH